MPKGTRKGKSDRNRHDGSLQTSDDDSVLDNASVISNCSENRSGEDGDEGDLAQEQLEDKLIEILDGLTQKSTQGRTNCLQSLTKALVKNVVPTFVRDRHFTICDSIEKSLKKGTAEEKSAAADLVPLICVQLGEEDSSEIVEKALRPVLLATVCDNSVAAGVRAKCCLALGTMALIAGGDLGDNLALMKQLENIFSGSFLKGDGSIPTITPETANLHAAALSAWTLLLTNLPQGSVVDLLNNNNLTSVDNLAELLDSIHLDVRLTAGEALALIFEEGRKIEGMDFGEDWAWSITETITKLATDSNKFRAKKDRKQQRATFRDILQFIEADISTNVQVKFGREVLVMGTWSKRKQYDSLCTVLGPGINIHLAENDLLRDIFEITTPILQASDGPAHLQLNIERNRKRLLNAANFKARTISRAKNRDKRSDF